MLRSQKEDKVAAMHESFQNATLVVVTHQSGMSVAESTDLRRQVRDAGAGFRVTKNRLAKIALKGTPFETLDGLFTGPTAVAYGDDPVAAAKVLVSYAKKNEKLTVIGGGLGGQLLDAKGVEALTTLPSIEELRAKLLGLLQAPAADLVRLFPVPAQNMVGVLAAPGGQLARVFGAYAAQGEAA